MTYPHSFFVACHCVVVMPSINGMKDIFVPMDQAGRVVLPKSVRQELAIQPGALLKLSIEGTSVMLTPGGFKTGLKRKGKALVFANLEDAGLKTETVNNVLAQTRPESVPHFLPPIPTPTQGQ